MLSRLQTDVQRKKEKSIEEKKSALALSQKFFAVTHMWIQQI